MGFHVSLLCETFQLPSHVSVYFTSIVVYFKFIHYQHKKVNKLKVFFYLTEKKVEKNCGKLIFYFRN